MWQNNVLSNLTLSNGNIVLPVSIVVFAEILLLAKIMELAHVENDLGNLFVFF